MAGAMTAAMAAAMAGTVAGTVVVGKWWMDGHLAVGGGRAVDLPTKMRVARALGGHCAQCVHGACMGGATSES